MEEKKLISVIVPCYNEEDVLPMFYEEIQKISGKMQKDHPELTFEYLFIDDGSKDRTLSILRGMAREDSRVRFISFSRNFGKEAGMYAGLSNAKGDYCVVMDADLQHPPKFLPLMYAAVKSGCYDCATTRRVSREGESKVRSWFARLFYKIMNKISQTEIVDGAQDFRFMTRQMVDAVLAMAEKNRFSKGIFSWVGFRVKYIEYENVERAAGTTSWSFWGLFRYSIEGILGFSTFPLALSTIIGSLLSGVGLIALIAALIVNHAAEEAAGAGTVIAALILFSGIQLISVGILGMYLSKMYLEVKNRPVYLVRETEQNFRQFPEPEEYMTLPAPKNVLMLEEEPEFSEPEEIPEKEDASLSQAKRLKQETDREFDEIVSAAMQDEEEAPAEEVYEDEEVYAEEDAYVESEEESVAEEAEEEPAAEEVTEEAAEPEAEEEDEEPAEEDEDVYYDEDGNPEAVTRVMPAVKPEEQETSGKKKFEVSIDYDSLDDYVDEDEDQGQPKEADDDAEYEEEAYDEADGDEAYDEEYDDDEYDGVYEEEEYEEAPAPVRAKRTVRETAPESGSFGDKFAAFIEMLKQKFAELKEKLNSDSTIDAYEAAIDAADPHDDYDEEYDEEYAEDYDEEYDDDAYDEPYDDDDYYEEDDDEDAGF